MISIVQRQQLCSDSKYRWPLLGMVYEALCYRHAHSCLRIAIIHSEHPQILLRPPIRARRVTLLDVEPITYPSIRWRVISVTVVLALIIAQPRQEWHSLLCTARHSCRGTGVCTAATSGWYTANVYTSAACWRVAGVDKSSSAWCVDRRHVFCQPCPHAALMPW